MYGILTYIWVIFEVNVGKYSIHGSYGMACWKLTDFVNDMIFPAKSFRPIFTRGFPSSPPQTGIRPDPEVHSWEERYELWRKQGQIGDERGLKLGESVSVKFQVQMFHECSNSTPFAPSDWLSVVAPAPRGGAASAMRSSIGALARRFRAPRQPSNFRARQFSDGPQVESDSRLVSVRGTRRLHQ